MFLPRNATLNVMHLKCNSTDPWCPSSWKPWKYRWPSFDGSLLTIDKLHFTKNVALEKIPTSMTFTLVDGNRQHGPKVNSTSINEVL